MIKEIQYQGYATEPSDYECADGQLATSLNVISEDGQLKPVFQPETVCQMQPGEKVVLVHETAAYKHFILHDTVNNSLKWMTEPDYDPEEICSLSTAVLYSVSAIGNTLVVLASDGLRYVLWNDGEYKDLGQKIPELKIRFGLASEMTCYPKDTNMGQHAERAKLKIRVDGSDYAMPFVNDNWGDVRPKDDWEVPASWEDAYTFSLESYDGVPTMSAVINRWTNFAMGNVNRLVAEATKDQKFTQPFLVRWAYRLYDDSHVMHSDPVLLIPSSKYPFFAMDMGPNENAFRVVDTDHNNRNIHLEGRAYGFAGKLMAEIVNNDNSATINALTGDWKDIVKGVDIYVSPPIYTYDQSGKVWGWTCMDDEGAWDDFFTQGKTEHSGYTAYGQYSFEDIFTRWNSVSGVNLNERYYRAWNNSHPLPDYILTMPEKKEEDIHNSVEPAAFYKIASYRIDAQELTALQTSEQAVNIDDGVLESLLARETLEDDYHSRDLITAKQAFVYNARLNLTGITQKLHKPLPAETAWAADYHIAGVHRSWTILIEAKDGDTTHVIASDASTNDSALPRYIFYGNRKATTAWLTYTEGSTQHKWKFTLQEHPHLEGVYWFGGLAKEITESETQDTLPQPTDTAIDYPNKIFTSQVNNPFFFPLLGINTVGVGTILGISAAVKAMSQGQFGQFPLYAFTTDGVWALGVSGTGSFSNITPVTRDVCINTESITQIDDAVLFATDRGIMLIQGSEAKCITDTIYSEAPFDVLGLPGMDQLHAKLGHSADTCLPVKPFLGFLDGCRMVYDYVHQHIIVFNPTMQTVSGVTSPAYTYAYVYSLKSKLWGMMFSNLSSPINSYPEALAMTQDNRLVSFSMRDEDAVCKALYVTRPLKLDAVDVYKTVSGLIQRGHFERGDVGTALYGSRDLYNWFLVWSSRDHTLRNFRGTPYKYFRIAGLATLTEGKTIFGASVDMEMKHTNKLR